MGYNRAMRFRLGYVLGFASGYYLGAKAGRARYEQLNEMIDKVRGSDAFEATAEKARAIVDDQVERVKEVVEERVGQAKQAVEQSQGTNGHQASGIPYDEVASDLPPGPPPAGSLSDDPPPGGPPA
jgi:hypothetical protein